MTSTNAPREPVSGRQIAKGAAWLMLFKMIDKSIGLVSTLFLARLLVPADFGLVAMATAVVAFTQLMGAFGFDSALIQRQDARREHYDTAWTFNVIFGVAVAVALSLLAVPMAHFYRDDRLVAIMLVLGIGALVGGFENIGTVAFRKDMDFRNEFRFLLIKRVVSFSVTMLLAFELRSYWALVAGAVTSRILSAWISYRLHPFRPRLTLTARADLMHFSKWIFLSSLIGFFTGKSTDFILGRTVGSHGLGVYNISWEIAVMPSSELIAPLNRAVFPAYARLSGQPAELRSRFLEVFGVICLIAIPVSGGLFAVADAAVRVVLGSQWLESIPLIQIFAVSGLIGALQSNLYLVIVAMGKPQANTLLSACLLLVSLPLTIWASLNHGVLGASYAMLCYSIVGMFGILIIFTRITRISIASLLGVAWRPACCAALMVVALLWLDGTQALAAASVPGHLARLLFLCAAGAMIYIVSAWCLWRFCGAPVGAERFVLDLFGLLGQRAAAWFRRAGAA
ncbi:MAG: lipopolysaccharide biosynthesis protein [Gallionella sp.]|nr:lipopolysaccharide biosynthesis protein [Gallionella sp.]